MAARSIRKFRVTPLRVPQSAAGVVFFGGSFDPPHKAHIVLSRNLRRRRLGPGWWLVFVPAAQSPLKQHGPRAAASHRIAMLQIATSGLKDSLVWTDEIARGGWRPSYWIQTLERAARVLPADTPMRFIIGSDQAVVFHRWKQFREILRIAKPLVLVRPPHGSKASVLRAMKRTGVWSAEELQQWRDSLDDETVLMTSSTRARDVVGRKGNSSPWLSPGVRAYVAKHHLYRS